jgi:hypothetical protein
MALRASAMRCIWARSAGDRSSPSRRFCNSEIWAEVAGICSLKACATALSLLSDKARVRAAFVSVRPAQRVAVCTRSVISLVSASASAWVWAER